MGGNLKFIFQSYALNLKKEYEYKVSFFLSILMMIANDAFFIIQWLVIFKIVPDLGGFRFEHIMLLWGVSAGAYGISHMFFTGIFDLSDYIYNGKLDVFLTQPKNPLIAIACSKTDPSAIGDLIYAFVALILAGASWSQFLLCVPFMIISAIVFASFTAIYMCLGFYFKQGGRIGSMMSSSIMNFANYPVSIYDKVTKVILFTVIPTGFFTFLPVSIMMHFNIWFLLGYLAFAVILTVFAFVFFNAGLKKYSSGGLGGTRV